MIVVFPDDPLSYSLSIFSAMKRQHRAKSQWLQCTINHCCQTSVTSEMSGLQINATSEKSAIWCKGDNGKKLTLHQEVHYLLKKITIGIEVSVAEWRSRSVLGPKHRGPRVETSLC